MPVIIGRRKEQDDLTEYCRSRKAELICIYGRRRVGKTYLVDNTFRGRIAFRATGSEDRKTRTQLRVFHEALRSQGIENRSIPTDWFEAFGRLRALLQQPDIPRSEEGRRIVFLDEFPWFATKRSDFLVAFADFWNSWASTQDDLCIIICGSATSWIIKNIFENTGSMYNRVTRQIYLAPFTLRETKELTGAMGLEWDEDAVLLCHMIFGGLPYYLDMLDRRKSLAQNVDSLCLDVRAPLRREVPHLMEATLGDSPLYRDILRELSGSRAGIHRTELELRLCPKGGGSFQRALNDLEKCGYLRRYHNPYEKNHPSIYQLVDLFLLFSFNFIERRDVLSWSDYDQTPSYYAWRGNAFEIVCLNHIAQIKHTLGISAVRSVEFPWTSTSTNPGAQIDLVIERADCVTNLCEMKYTDDTFSIDKAYELELRRKREMFRQETATRQATQLTIVSANGLRQNAHSWDVANFVKGSDLFVF